MDRIFAFRCVALMALVESVAGCAVEPKREEIANAAEDSSITQPLAAAVAMPLTRKHLTLVFNPILENQGGKRLIGFIGWNAPGSLITQYYADVQTASHGLLNYEERERIIIDAYPRKEDGFQYNDDTFLACWNDLTRAACHKPDQSDGFGYAINYKSVLDQYRVCERFNAGEFEELWLFGAPFMGFWEANQAGLGAFDTNGPIVTGTACNGLLNIMGFSYGAGVAEMLEDLGHRVEGTMRHFLPTPFAEFTRYDLTNPGQSHCGTVHFAPNSDRDYDWSNPRTVQSYCDDWYKYPAPRTQRAPINCTAWGCNARQHKIWWLQHLPHVAGFSGDGSWNNWWTYIATRTNSIRNTCDNGVQLGGTACNPSDPAAEFVCVDPNNVFRQWQRRACSTGLTCSGTMCQAPTAPCSSPCAQCILSQRTDILPFYQSNGWDISCGNWDKITANWCGIDPTGCRNVRVAGCRASCGGVIGDYNNDALMDVYGIKKGPTTGTGKTEAHILSAASGFLGYALQTGTALPLTGTSNAWVFRLGDYNSDGITDLFAILKGPTTGTGRTEVHVLNGANGFQSFLAQTGTALHLTGTDYAWDFAIGDYNRDGKPDIYCIKKGPATGTNSTEIHVLNGATGYQTFLAQTGTALGITGTDNGWVFRVGDHNRDGRLDVYAVAKAPTSGSGKTEVHILSGATVFQSFLLRTATTLGMVGTDHAWDFVIGDYNRDGKTDLYGLRKTGGSRTELHILDGASSYQSFLLQTQTALPILGVDSGFVFAPGALPL